MLIRHVAIGLLKLGLIFILPAYLAGLLLFVMKSKDKKRIKIIVLGAFFALVEAVVFIEKGLPFFFGNIYNMVSMSPNIALQFVLGLIFDGAWLTYAWHRSDNIAVLFEKMFGKRKGVVKAVSRG